MIFIFSLPKEYSLGLWEASPNSFLQGSPRQDFQSYQSVEKQQKVDGRARRSKIQRLKYLQTTEEAGIEKGCDPYSPTVIVTTNHQTGSCARRI
jgi:hypothetical protein